MEIRQILVNVDIDGFPPALLECAIGLANRFKAGLIGICAAEPASVMMAYEGAAAAAEIYEQERQEIEKDLAETERRFRELVPGNIPLQWQSDVERPNVRVARAARCADLIVSGSGLGLPNQNYQRSINAGELIVKAGRPLLVVGSGLSEIKADAVVIGWKDSKEARRAIVDALPLLQAARQVTVATIHEDDFGDEKASLRDVLAWLRNHAIDPQGDIYPPTDGAAGTLESIAKGLGADLIVSGGFGHSRLREWLFGGMTRDLLTDRTVHRFMSN